MGCVPYRSDLNSHEFFGKNIRSLDLYNSAALSVIFNREARTEKEGLLMVAGTYDEKQNEILIFQYPQNTLLRARKAAPVPVIRGGCHHKADVSSVSIVPFCSDNPFVVAAGDSQGDITLYRPSIEMQELDQIAQWAPFTASAQCTATKSFVSSNPKLVAGSDDGTACVVDLDAAKPIESLSSLLGCKGDGVRDVDFPSPNCVALACSSGTVRFYDTRQRNNETITLRNASTSSLLGLTSLEVNRDTLQVVATGDAEGNLQVWDLRATGRPLLSAKKHNGPIWQSRWNPKEDMQVQHTTHVRVIFCSFLRLYF